MRFWDANAVVPLTVNEERSADMRTLLRSDSELVVWWGTRPECISALARKGRERAINPMGEAQARVLLFQLSRSWNEVQPSNRIRTLAEGFLDAHPLKAADALQLAAAFVWCAGLTLNREFVCLDRQLSSAATTEGFTVIS